MLSKLRNFSKTKFSTILVGIIIVPFVLWGMGSVFSGGNTNRIAKIENENISTQDFIDFINMSNLDLNYIKNNINNNLIEQLLSQLISQTMLRLEIKNFDILISDNVLKNKLLSNKLFFDENNKFSRIKYEKYLLENNLSAPIFEKKYKEDELRKQLFSYIDGGIKSPFFLLNKKYIFENKKIDVEYINLEKEYKTSFTNEDYKKFINDNKDQLMVDFIDFSYSEIRPEDLIDSKEFNNEFYKIIDEIDNDILNGKSINEISKRFNLKISEVNNYNKIRDNSPNNYENIFKKRNDSNVQLIENSDHFLIFQVSNKNTKVPSLENQNFKKELNTNILLNEKYEYNKMLLEKIEKNNFTNLDFDNIGNKNPKQKITIDSINDKDIFDENSIKLIYSIGSKGFVLTSDINNNVYVVKIINIYSENIPNEKKIINKYNMSVINDLKSSIYLSYDNLVNKNYDITINENTIERVKNYFK